MSSVYKNKALRERKKALTAAWIIDYFLCYYFLFSAYFLIIMFQGYDDPAEELQVKTLIWLFPAAIVMNLIVSKFFSTPGKALLERTNKFLKGFNKEKTESRSFLKSFSGVSILILIALTFIIGFKVTNVSLYALFNKDGLRGASRIVNALANPNLNILGEVLKQMLVTIYTAFIATAFAIPIAFLASFLGARNLMKDSLTSKITYNVVRFIFNVIRSVEPLIWAIIFSIWVTIGPFCGTLALMLHSVASLGKLYSEQIENIDDGPLEAIQATGANKIQVIWNAVVPQIVLPYLSFTIYRWDINVRMATVIGLVGAGGIGKLLLQYQGQGQWNEVGTIAIVIAIVVWAMDFLSARIREALS